MKTIFEISQQEICDRTGIGKSTMSMYMNGKHIPRQDKISVIADAFGIDPAWLMGYDVPLRRTASPDEAEYQRMFDALRRSPQLTKIMKCVIAMPDKERNAIEALAESLTIPR